MKKRLIILLSAACLTLSGCQPAQPPERISITLGNWAGVETESYEKVMQKYKEDFEKENPNIKIVPQPYNYEVNTFIAKAESGQLPNLIHTYYTEPEKIIRAGYVREITDAVKKYGYVQHIREDLMELCSKDGKIYGIPYIVYVLGLWCNVELFRNAGLVDEEGIPIFPRTWDELAETAVLIEKRTGKKGMLIPTKENLGGWHYYSIASSFGAEFEKFDENGNIHADFTSDAAVKAMQYIKDLKWKYNVLPDNTLLGWADYKGEFSMGNVAMAIGATDNMIDFAEMGFDKDNFAICRLPAGEGGQISQMGGNLIMFSKNTTDAQLDACMKWMQFSGFTPESTERKKQALEEKLIQENNTGAIILEKNLEVWKNELESPEIDAIKKKYTNVDYNLQRDFFEYGANHIKPELPYNAQEFYSLIDKVIQKMLDDKNADPYTELKTAEDSFTELYLNTMNG